MTVDVSDVFGIAGELGDWSILHVPSDSCFPLRYAKRPPDAVIAAIWDAMTEDDRVAAISARIEEAIEGFPLSVQRLFWSDAVMADDCDRNPWAVLMRDQERLQRLNDEDC